MGSSYLILAQAAPGGSPFSTILFIGALFLIMYFVMIRPQQKQLKQQREMLASLKKGDEVITQGGMVGKVFQVTEKMVTLEVASNVRVRVLKTSVQGKVTLGEEEAAKPEEKAEKKEER